MYDESDVRSAYNSGFWIGAVSGFFTSLIIFALVGLYLP